MKPHGSFRLLLAIAFLGSLAISCANQPAPGPPPDTRAADEATIRANDADFVTAAQTKDLDKAVAHYMDDAVLFAPGAPAVVGKDNIRKFFEPIINGPAMQFTFSDVKVDVARSGDIAVDSGSFESTGKDAKGKPVTQKGRFVLVWKKQPDGSWKIAADTSANEK
jgi:uncharacterized protein (TIGR02246 family)